MYIINERKMLIHFTTLNMHLHKINDPVQNKVMQSKLEFLYIFLYKII